MLNRFTNRHQNGSQKHLKLLLLCLALILLVIIILWPSLSSLFNTQVVPTKHQPIEQTDTSLNVAKDIHLDGTDNNKQPYTLTASKAIEDNEKKTLEVFSPHVTIKLNSGAIVSLNADRGVFYQDARKIELISNVTLTHSTGYKFSTSLVWVELDKSLAYGHDMVEGDGPQGKINASKGFQLINKGEIVKFFGRPNLFLSKEKQ